MRNFNYSLIKMLMKQTMKQTMNIFIGGVLAFALFSSLNSFAFAQNGCANATSVVDLKGYITATNIRGGHGDSQGRIYMSKESYEDATGKNSPVDFQVRLGKNTMTWEGMGWSEDIGWINFSGNQEDRIAFAQDVRGKENLWGYWNGDLDLSSVVYNNQTGSFFGYGVSANYTGIGNNEEENSGQIEKDVMVGLGILDFSNVEIPETTNCDEWVSLFLVEGANKTTSRKHFMDCGQRRAKLAWTSENVHDCKAVKGPWDNLNGPRNTKSLGEKSQLFFGKGGKSDKVLFGLECVGDDSGKKVAGYAAVSCGEIDSTEIDSMINQFIKPIFKEV